MPTFRKMDWCKSTLQTKAQLKTTPKILCLTITGVSWKTKTEKRKLNLKSSKRSKFKGDLFNPDPHLETLNLRSKES